MEEIKIHKREKKSKMLTIPVTQEEHETIMQFCKTQDATITAVVRTALKNTFKLDIN